MGVKLSQLAAPGKSGMWGDHSPSEGPVEYVNITLEDDRVVACVQCGLYFAKQESEPLAILIRGPNKDYHPMAKVGVEVMARNRASAEEFIAQIRTAMRRRNVYRGHILSIAETRMGNTEIKFHRLPCAPSLNLLQLQ